jgi:hypothetical protein
MSVHQNLQHLIMVFSDRAINRFDLVKKSIRFSNGQSQRKQPTMLPAFQLTFAGTQWKFDEQDRFRFWKTNPSSRFFVA